MQIARSFTISHLCTVCVKAMEVKDIYLQRAMDSLCHAAKMFVPEMG